MKIARTLLFVLIVAVSLAGLTDSARADTDTQPAPPNLDEGGRSDGGSTGGDPAITAPDPAASQPAVTPKKKQPEIPFYQNPMFLLLGAMLLMFVFMGRGKRKTEAKRKEMLSALKKGDKVTTIGGIVGTIMEVRDDEVTVKIDESSNTRMRFARWAVRGVGSGSKTEEPEGRK